VAQETLGDGGAVIGPCPPVDGVQGLWLAGRQAGQRLSVMLFADEATAEAMFAEVGERPAAGLRRLGVRERGRRRYPGGRRRRAPGRALLQVASERKARMIVVGTHGERPLTGAVLGSVPHRLLHLSRVPVLVVPVRP